MTEDKQLFIYSKQNHQTVNSLSEEIQDIFKYEDKRIKTFSSWKVDCPVDAARLAKAGFYYSGNGDEVICFSCKGHIKNWNYGDVVQKRHSELFPNCNFVNNRSSNVPMNQTNKMNERCKNATKTGPQHSIILGRETPIIDFNKMQSVQERLKSYALNWPLPCINIRNLAEAGFFYLGYEDKVQCPFCKGILGNWKIGDDPYKEHAKHFPHCNSLGDILSNLSFKKDSYFESDSDKLCNKATRNAYDLCNKSTHKSDDVYNKSTQNSDDICNKSTQNLEDFCNNLTKKSDDVCNKSTQNLEDFCDNLSNKSDDLCKKLTNNSDSPSKSRLLHKNQEHLNLQKLGVLLHSVPASPHHASFNSRLQSFASWPVASPVFKENLAKAGFFYIGIEDHTKCFHCDGGLCNWEFGDDPWIEHARWFRNCGFLHLNKGASFIEDCNTRYLDKVEIDVSPQTPQMLSETLMLNVDEAMNSTIVKNVLGTSGFPPYVIRAAVLRQIKETGSSFSTKEDLCLAVTSLKNEMEKKPLQMDNFPTTDLKTNNIGVIQWASDNNVKDMKLKRNLMEISSDANTKSNVDISEESSISKDQYLCIICMEQKVGVVFLPCGHLLACTECASALKLCALCRKTIQATVRAYLP